MSKEVRRLLEREKHNCKLFEANTPQESKKHEEPFFHFKQSQDKGKSTFTVGFIICVSDPLSKIWVNPGDKAPKEEPGLGYLRTFSYKYGV